MDPKKKKQLSSMSAPDGPKSGALSNMTGAAMKGIRKFGNDVRTAVDVLKSPVTRINQVKKALAPVEKPPVSGTAASGATTVGGKSPVKSGGFVQRKAVAPKPFVDRKKRNKI